MEKRWSKAEIAHLKRSAEKQSAEELAQRFRTDTETVRRKLAQLGLGSADAEISSLMVEGKAYLFTGRLQPYGLLGIGIVDGDLSVDKTDGGHRRIHLQDVLTLSSDRSIPSKSTKPG